MDAVDEHILTPEHDLKPFAPEDVHHHRPWHGCNGPCVERGVIRHRGNRWSERRKKQTATGLEMFRKTLDQAEAGDNIGARPWH